jgi:hypothetical protein
VTEQLTPEAVTLMIAGLVVFWVSIAALVRQPGRQRAVRAASKPRESRG